jgi:hypothetical protein
MGQQLFLFLSLFLPLEYFVALAATILIFRIGADALPRVPSLLNDVVAFTMSSFGGKRENTVVQ